MLSSHERSRNIYITDNFYSHIKNLLHCSNYYECNHRFRSMLGWNKLQFMDTRVSRAGSLFLISKLDEVEKKSIKNYFYFFKRALLLDLNLNFIGSSNHDRYFWNYEVSYRIGFLPSPALMPKFLIKNSFPSFLFKHPRTMKYN